MTFRSVPASIYGLDDLSWLAEIAFQSLLKPSLRASLKFTFQDRDIGATEVQCSQSDGDDLQTGAVKFSRFINLHGGLE